MAFYLETMRSFNWLRAAGLYAKWWLILEKNSLLTVLLRKLYAKMLVLTFLDLCLKSTINTRTTLVSLCKSKTNTKRSTETRTLCFLLKLILLTTIWLIESRSTLLNMIKRDLLYLLIDLWPELRFARNIWELLERKRSTGKTLLWWLNS